MIGVGIVTYNRPEYERMAIESVLEHLKDVEKIYVYNDGGTPIEQVGREVVINAEENHGVGYAKNRLLELMMADGCDDMFLMEDDMEILDGDIIARYILAAELAGLDHLNFAQHAWVPQRPMRVEGDLGFYQNCVGSFCYYGRSAIERAGYMDEHFRNAWEHVEHTNRIYHGEFWHEWPDLINSRDYIRQQPNALETSTIRDDPEWEKNVEEGVAYWSEKGNCPL